MWIQAFCIIARQIFCLTQHRLADYRVTIIRIFGYKNYYRLWAYLIQEIYVLIFGDFGYSTFFSHYSSMWCPFPVATGPCCYFKSFVETVYCVITILVFFHGDILSCLASVFRRVGFSFALEKHKQHWYSTSSNVSRIVPAPKEHVPPSSSQARSYSSRNHCR